MTDADYRRAQEALFGALSGGRSGARVVCGRFGPLEFELDGLALLPTSLGLRAFGTLRHRAFVRELDAELARRGVPDDKTYASSEVFVGNVTLCRFTRPPAAALARAVEALRGFAPGGYRVAGLELVECDEVCSAATRHSHAALGLSGPA